MATVRSIGRAPEPLAFVVAGGGDLTEAAVRSNLADLLGASPVAEDGYLSNKCAREPYPILVVTGDTVPASMVLVYEWLQWAAIPYTLVVEQTVAGKAADDLIRDARDVHQVLNPDMTLATSALLIKSNQHAGREVRLVGLGGPTREDITYYGLVGYALSQGIVTEDLTEARHPITLPAETPPVEEEVKPTRRRRASATVVKGEAPKVLKPVQQPLLFTEPADEPQPHPAPMRPDRRFEEVVERMTKPQRVAEPPKNTEIPKALVDWLRDTTVEEVHAALMYLITALGPVTSETV